MEIEFAGFQKYSTITLGFNLCLDQKFVSKISSHFVSMFLWSIHLDTAAKISLLFMIIVISYWSSARGNFPIMCFELWVDIESKIYNLESFPVSEIFLPFHPLVREKFFINSMATQLFCLLFSGVEMKQNKKRNFFISFLCFMHSEKV